MSWSSPKSIDNPKLRQPNPNSANPDRQHSRRCVTDSPKSSGDAGLVQRFPRAGKDRKMWTETTQPRYRREGLRYASDVTDHEWAQIEALVPAPKKLGRPRTTPMRQVVNALL
jgi:hypothetical protein